MSYPEQNPQEPRVLPGYFSPAAPPPQGDPRQTSGVPAPAPQYQAAQQYQGHQMPAPVQPYGAPPLQHGAVHPQSQPLPSATFLQAVGRFYGRYATFSGRASKSEFWWVAAGMSGLFLLGAIFNAIVGADWVAGAYVMFLMASIVPSIALIFRRLHDANLSGGLAFLWLVPYIGFLIVGILALMPSTAQGARFDKQHR